MCTFLCVQHFAWTRKNYSSFEDSRKYNWIPGNFRKHSGKWFSELWKHWPSLPGHPGNDWVGWGALYIPGHLRNINFHGNTFTKQKTYTKFLKAHIWSIHPHYWESLGKPSSHILTVSLVSHGAFVWYGMTDETVSLDCDNDQVFLDGVVIPQD